jgi:hypothetical protein
VSSKRPIKSDLGMLETKKLLSEYVERGIVDHRVLDLLVTDKGCAAVENEILDYKRTISTDSQSLAKCAVQIVSLHNAFGGYLIFGVEEQARDQGFRPCGLPPATVNTQQLKTIIQNYTGRTIDIRYADIAVRFQGSDLNLGLLFVPKRATSQAPVKFGKTGPSKDGSPLFGADDVFFRLLDTNARARTSEDWWFLASERIAPATTTPPLSVPLVWTRKRIVDENLPDRNLICPRFVGRDDKILELWQWLSDDLQFAKVLAGDGGKGKTSIAYQFSEEICRSHPYDFEKVIWLTAKTLQFRGLRDEYDPVQANYGSYTELLTALCDKLPILPGELEGSSPHLLKQHLRRALEEIHTFVVIDDVDTLAVEEQRMVLEMALQVGNKSSRFLLTTRKNFTYSADLCLVIPGFESDDYIEYVHDLCSRIEIPTLSIAAIEKLRRATEGSPLYTESLLRLIRNNMRVDEAIARWKDELGLKVRRAALDREIKHLTLESRRVLLAAVYLFECSYTELRQATGYDDERLMQCIDELKALFLLSAPRIIAKEGRFSVQSNTRTLVLTYEKTLVADPQSIRKKCEKIRTGAKGITKAGDKRETSKAITQANAFLREKLPDEALETLQMGLRRSPSDPDLLFALAKTHLSRDPPDHAAAKKSLKDSYDQGNRRYQLYATWYDCELDSSHFVGAIEVAGLALGDDIAERHEWLVKRAVAHRASSQLRERSGDSDGAIEDLRACNEDLKIAWPLPNRNQAEEIHASLVTVGQALAEVALRHARGIPGWVRFLDVLNEIIVPPAQTPAVAQQIVHAVGRIAAECFGRDRVSVQEENLVASLLRAATTYIAANRRGKNADSFREAENEISRISTQLAALTGNTPAGQQSLPSDTGGFDLFLAHNSQDKPAVRSIAQQLENRGVSVWLDEKEIPPGQLFQDYIQKALPSAKTVAVFVGPTGLGRWQSLELRSAISRAVESGIPVIPVFLPNAKDVSADLPFLMEFNHVRFRSLDDKAALERLVWGTKLGKPAISRQGREGD